MTTTKKKKKNKTPLAAFLSDTHLKEDNLELVVSVFQQFIKNCEDHNVKVAFFIGDWFYERSGQTLACQLVTRYIMELIEQSGITMYFLPGNHDKRNLSSRSSYLHAYITERDKHLSLVESYERILVGDILIHMIPYFQEGEVYTEQLQQVDYSPKLKNILLTHIAVNGVRNNDGSVVDSGVAVKAFKKFDRVFVGHYHDFSTLNDGQIVYHGSTHQAHYGEQSGDKGFTFLYDDLSYGRIAADFPKYIHIKVESSDKEEVRTMLQKVDSGEFKTSNVRITFKGSYSDIQSVDKQHFEKMGIDIRFENTVEKEVEDLIASETVTTFDKKEIMKQFLFYSKENNFTPAQRTQGVKLLSRV